MSAEILATNSELENNTKFFEDAQLTYIISISILFYEKFLCCFD